MQIFTFIIFFAVDMADYRNPPSVGGQSFASDTTCDTVLPLDNGLDPIDEDVPWGKSQEKTAGKLPKKPKRTGTKRKIDARHQPYKIETSVCGHQPFFESESMYTLLKRGPNLFFKYFFLSFGTGLFYPPRAPAKVKLFLGSFV